MKSKDQEKINHQIMAYFLAILFRRKNFMGSVANWHPKRFYVLPTHLENFII